VASARLAALQEDGILSELADAVRTRRVSSHQLVERSLERIARLDGQLNAVVALRADLALGEARALDARVAAGGDPGPLAGVPVLVKDLEDVAGLRTTQGSALFADDPPATRDGLTPARLRAAGAIVVGKTNLPEFATEGYSANLIFGATRNPWGLQWSPGGSSGGSGAALAAGLAPIATATDGGGSVRIPAALCGLAGLKPTNGVIARRPIPDWIDYSTDGPLATTVADLRLLLAVQSGPAPGDPTALPFPPPPGAARPARLYAAPRFAPWGPLPGVVQSAFDEAVAAFADLVALPAESLDPERIFATGNPDTDWFIVAAAEHVSSLGRGVVEQNLDRLHPGARWFLEEGLRVTLDGYLAARRRRFGYVRELDELLGEDGVVLSPTIASQGWLAEGRLSTDDQVGALPGEVYNTSVQNTTGHPALSLPAGRLPNGLPFGLQVTGPRFRDHLLLDLASSWEEARPWPRSAGGYEPFDTGLTR
jgi:Asp-tRNA(Asn)/Glu-tRNA(Gln) amidotransferase A subunit family amidase